MYLSHFDHQKRFDFLDGLINKLVSIKTGD